MRTADAPREATPDPYRKRLLHAAPPPFPSSPPPRPRWPRMRRRCLRTRPHRRACPGIRPGSRFPGGERRFPPKAAHRTRTAHAAAPAPAPAPVPAPAVAPAPAPEQPGWSRPRVCSPRTPEDFSCKVYCPSALLGVAMGTLPLGASVMDALCAAYGQAREDGTIRGTGARFSFELPMDNGCSVLIKGAPQGRPRQQLGGAVPHLLREGIAP